MEKRRPLKQAQGNTIFSLVELHEMGRQDTFRARGPLGMVLEGLSWFSRKVLGGVWPPLGPLDPPGLP